MSLLERDEEATDTETCGLLHALVRLQKPSVAVEAGTYRGHGSAAIADALEANGGGCLHTADPEDHGVLCTCRLQYHPVGFLEMLEAVPELDFAFIDASGPGDPRDSSIRWTHFRASREKLVPGGLICVHDTATEGWSDESVRHRIRDACQVNLSFGKGLSIYHA